MTLRTNPLNDSRSIFRTDSQIWGVRLYRPFCPYMWGFYKCKNQVLGVHAVNLKEYNGRVDSLDSLRFKNLKIPVFLDKRRIGCLLDLGNVVRISM